MEKQQELPLTLPPRNHLWIHIPIALFIGMTLFSIYQSKSHQLETMNDRNKLAAAMVKACIDTNPLRWELNASAYLGPRVKCVRAEFKRKVKPKRRR